MKWTTETAFEVRLVERMWLRGDGIRVECCGTISMRGIVIEVAVGPVSQPLVLSRRKRQIIHAQVTEVAECVAVVRRQLFSLLVSGCVSGISEPVEIGRAQRFMFFSRARQLIEQIRLGQVRG